MKIIWDIKAKDTWLKTLLYIQAEFGYRSALKFRKETSKASEQIAKFPQSGSIEPLLTSSKFEFRSVLFGVYNKLIYHISEEAIYIVDVWDTRREPKQQADETIEK